MLVRITSSFKSTLSKSNRNGPGSSSRARTLATLKKWNEYIRENPYAYERGGEGYQKIEEIVNGLSHSELQVFVNLSGAAKSFGSMSKEAW